MTKANSSSQAWGSFLMKAYSIVLVLMGVDQLTKQWALATVFNPPRVIEVLPFFNLVPVWNSGMSFGLFSDGGAFVKYGLTMIAVGVGIGLPIYARRWDRIAQYGALLMASGALGNALDRMIYGRVIDFIDIFAGQYHWPAFNVADMAVTCGAGCILWSSFTDRHVKE